MRHDQAIRLADGTVLPGGTVADGDALVREGNVINGVARPVHTYTYAATIVGATDNFTPTGDVTKAAVAAAAAPELRAHAIGKTGLLVCVSFITATGDGTTLIDVKLGGGVAGSFLLAPGIGFAPLAIPVSPGVDLSFEFSAGTVPGPTILDAFVQT